MLETGILSSTVNRALPYSRWPDPPQTTLRLPWNPSSQTTLRLPWNVSSQTTLHLPWNALSEMNPRCAWRAHCSWSGMIGPCERHGCCSSLASLSRGRCLSLCTEEGLCKLFKASSAKEGIRELGLHTSVVSQKCQV